MATITFKSGEEYLLKLTRLEKEAVEKVLRPRHPRRGEGSG